MKFFFYCRPCSQDNDRQRTIAAMYFINDSPTLEERIKQRKQRARNAAGNENRLERVRNMRTQLATGTQADKEQKFDDSQLNQTKLEKLVNEARGRDRQTSNSRNNDIDSCRKTNDVSPVRRNDDIDLYKKINDVSPIHQYKKNKDLSPARHDKGIPSYKKSDGSRNKDIYPYNKKKEFPSPRKHLSKLPNKVNDDLTTVGRNVAFSPELPFRYHEESYGFDKEFEERRPTNKVNEIQKQTNTRFIQDASRSVYEAHDYNYDDFLDSQDMRHDKSVS